MPSAEESPSETVISLHGVTKTYTIWDDPAARLMAPLRRLWSGGKPAAATRQFTAVKAISLAITRGECLGIIGRNGAGKSTLLQMIAGTVQPSTGTIAVHGRVAALLELGSGFNPDFTGRENIHLNAAILGLTKPEIAQKFDAIVAYSGIGEFIDQPVRTYSSGMTLRLAFAVCVHVDADILIIDEALAVGDARFQFKCHATLEQMLKEGRTIIFVSHDTNAVKRMCRTAVLLERGEVLLKGSPNDVTNIYTKLITSPHGVEAIRDDLAALRQRTETGEGRPHSGEAIDGTNSSESAGAQPPASSLPAPASLLASDLAASASENLLTEERSHQQISDKEYAYGGEMGRIETVTLTDADDQPRLAFPAGSRIRVRLSCLAAQTIPDPIYALTIKDVRGQEIYGTNTYFQNQSPPSVPPGGRVEVRFEVQLNVQAGVYFISLGWVRLVNGEVQVIHRRYDSIRFDVMPRDKSFGLAHCPTTIEVKMPASAQRPA
ncbi:ABC transporter ATP-binding protein [Oleiharenicola lentus]|uniref:ABC transporter ATP-binding protein n=1 Tax=Oleiharenicola lentus TaxID=2508720 RepID=A0A4Q1C9P6_9BACT|nr:ABC transporter ATP-binding protein [Oleiharenicola lentus]RXK55704.1 ABC transporter ATP-binding protein [Oleiharenicola lentus]